MIAADANALIGVVGILIAAAGGLLAWFSRADRKKVDQWTLDLGAMDKSVTALETALEWSEKSRGIMEQRLGACDSRLSLVESREQQCQKNLTILLAEIVKLGGHPEGIEGLVLSDRR